MNFFLTVNSTAFVPLFFLVNVHFLNVQIIIAAAALAAAASEEGGF